MQRKQFHKVINIIIAIVWLVNGLFCKVLNLVPRHQKIVARILGEQYSVILTRAIGFSEILMAVWILSKIRSHLNASIQIIIIAIMNCIELAYAPDLLLWGRGNAVFAFLFIVLIYFNEFMFNKRLAV